MYTKAYLYELDETVGEINDLIDRVKYLLNKTVDSLFTYLPVDEVLPLKESCDIHTWNRGYDFTVTGFKKRSDGCIMMCGTYCNNKEDEEFLSYIYGYDSIKKLYEEIKDTFF